MEYLAGAIKQLKDNAQCPICFDTLVNPISTKCNHHFCSSCHKKLFQNKGKLSCPVCHASLTRRSCVKNSSLNSIIQAINDLLKSVIEDTGIDFSNECSVPVSTREAASINQLLPDGEKFTEPPRRATNINQVAPAGGKITETTADKKGTEDVSNQPPKVPTVSTKGQLVLGSSSGNKKISKHYKGKRENVEPNDSFMFPADFILPKRKLECKNKPSCEPVASKVSSWLTKNENNLNDFEEVSFLNGSIPPKISPDTNISFSTDELLSVSQVNADSNVQFPSQKNGMEIFLPNINENCGDVKDKEPKDPYEFISSQKSNTAKKLLKCAKRNSKKCGKRRKPLGLDISHLIQETYVKKRKLNDASFLPNAPVNDTFDQLMLSVKKPEIKILHNTENKHAYTNVAENDDEIFIFRSQNTNYSSSNNLPDFSSGSGEEWGPTRQDMIKLGRRKMEKDFKEQPLKSKLRRKSNVLKKNIMEKEDIENLNKTFQEVENYKLVTSSQVAREQMLEGRADNESESCKRTQNIDTAERNETLGPDKYDFSGRNSKKDNVNSGWCRANQFASNLKCSQIQSKTQKGANEPKKKLIVSGHSAMCNEPISSHNDVHNNSVFKNTTNDTSNIFLKPQIPYLDENLKKTELSSVSEEIGIRTSGCKPLRINSSPDEPVRYLNLSQSAERANIMNEVVKSLKSSLEKAAESGSTGAFNLRVSLDEVENNIVASSTKNDVISHKLTETDDETPFAVTMSTGTETIETIKENQKEYIGEIPMWTKGMSENLDGEAQCREAQNENGLETQYTLQNPYPDQDMVDDSQGRQNEICKIDSPAKYDTQKHRKTILVNSSNKMNASLCKQQILVVNKKNKINKVRFCETSDESDSDSLLSVSFFKLGSLDSKSKVTFWLLGSCITPSEKGDAVIPGILRFSKMCPVCCCGSVKCKGSSDSLQNSSPEVSGKNSSSSLQLGEQKVVLSASSEEIVIEDTLKFNEEVNRDGAVEVNKTNKQETVNINSLKSGDKCVTKDEGCNEVFNAKIECNDLDKKNEDVNILSLKQLKEKISDEDIFLSGQKSEIISPLFEEHVNEDVGYQLSSTEKFPHNIPLSHGVCDANSEDIFLSCQNKTISQTTEYNLSKIKQSVSEVSEKCVQENNLKKKDVPLEVESSGLNKIFNTAEKRCGSMCSRTNEVKENDFDRKVFCNSTFVPAANSSSNPLNPENSLEVVGYKPSTEQDIFATDQNNLSLDKIYLSCENPLNPSTQKRVRPLCSYSSDEENIDEKTVKKSCTVSNLKTMNNAIFPSNSDSALNILDSKDADEFLNSEELLQKVMDNINEDLGYSKSNPPKFKGAKRKIPSDSEEEIEVMDTTDKRLIKSPQCEKQGNTCLEDDIFEDENDVDIIEDSPVKSKSNFYSGENSTGNKCLRENEGDEKLSLVSSSKFILPHSSFSNKKLHVPSKNELSSTSKSCEENKLLKSGSKTNKMSTIACNLFGSQSEMSVVNTGRNSSKSEAVNSVKENMNHQFTNKNARSVVNVAQSINSCSKLLFVCSSLPPSLVAKVKKFAQLFGANFAENFCIGMTHLIVNIDKNRTTPKTLKYLQAVAAKKWIVSYGWVLACVSAQKLVPEEPYEALDSLSGLDGPRRSRLSTVSLFKDVQICFIEPFESISMEKIVDLFMMCGGMVVDSPEGFTVTNRDVIRIIISDLEDDNIDSLCLNWITKHRAAAVHSDWLLDSIGTHQLQPLSMYLLGLCSKDQLLACGIPEKLLDDEDLESTVTSDMSES